MRDDNWTVQMSFFCLSHFGYYNYFATIVLSVISFLIAKN